MPVTISGTNGVTFPDSSLQAAAASPYVLKNRIINGDMRIDQRNAGASVTITATSASQYVLDRFYLRAESAAGSKVSVRQMNGVDSAASNYESGSTPAGFSNSQKITSLSAYTLGSSEHFGTTQAIEGFNVADLGWGTASASTVTLSFWVRSSLTGTFGGHFTNSAVNRCFVFSYTINAANTWEYKTITVTGDTSGTWLTNNGIGLYMSFSVAAGSSTTTAAGTWSSTFNRSVTGQTSLVGTNGATFYITGVQLEQNTTATPFERRLYNQELANCQRYFAKTFPQSVAVAQNSGDFNSLYTIAQVNNLSFSVTWKFPVTMRANPTVTTYSPNAANANWSPNATTPTAAVATASQELTVINGTTSTTAGNGYYIHASASIEL
jgi:hypothetical protein